MSDRAKMWVLSEGCLINIDDYRKYDRIYRLNKECQKSFDQVPTIDPDWDDE